MWTPRYGSYLDEPPGSAQERTAYFNTAAVALAGSAAMRGEVDEWSRAGLDDACRCPWRASGNAVMR
jgi:hypothetical protein